MVEIEIFQPDYRYGDVARYALVIGEDILLYLQNILELTNIIIDRLTKIECLSCSTSQEDRLQFEKISEH